MSAAVRRVLVVKLGALGDVVLALPPFAAIRAHHPGAELTVLTTAPFAGLLRLTGLFDHVAVDRRPRFWDLAGLLRLRRALRGFDRVYDLQTSSRSGWYHRLAGRPAWSGIAPGCSLPHANPGRNAMHTLERQREQLEMAGIAHFPPYTLPHRGGGAGTAILIPGAAPHRPRKRWPAARFAELAAELHRGGLTPVVVGTAAEAPLAAAILAACPAAVDMTGRTALTDLPDLIGGAAVAVGNDTGPTHLAAALGVPTLALFSADSDPALCRPRGAAVRVLSVADLADLPLARVAAALPTVHACSPASEDRR